MENPTVTLSEEVEHAVQALDFQRTHQMYWGQNECIFLERFLPSAVVEHYLIAELDQLRPHIHRNYIPKHKKGGSISYDTLAERAPVFLSLYRSPAFLDFLSGLVGARVMPCPENDPHACAPTSTPSQGTTSASTTTPRIIKAHAIRS